MLERQEKVLEHIVIGFFIKSEQLRQIPIVAE